MKRIDGAEERLDRHVLFLLTGDSLVLGDLRGARLEEYTPWAYCDVRPDGTITYYGVAEDHRTQPRPNVQAIDTRRWVEEAVAWLGLQGWQLISVVQADDGRTFYFKRPVQNEAADVDTAAISLQAATAAGLDAESPEDDAPGMPRVDPSRLIEEEFLPD